MKEQGYLTLNKNPPDFPGGSHQSVWVNLTCMLLKLYFCFRDNNCMYCMNNRGIEWLFLRKEMQKHIYIYIYIYIYIIYMYMCVCVCVFDNLWPGHIQKIHPASFITFSCIINVHNLPPFLRRHSWTTPRNTNLNAF